MIQLSTLPAPAAFAIPAAGGSPLTTTSDFALALASLTRPAPDAVAAARSSMPTMPVGDRHELAADGTILPPPADPARDPAAVVVAGPEREALVIGASRRTRRDPSAALEPEASITPHFAASPAELVAPVAPTGLAGDEEQAPATPLFPPALDVPQPAMVAIVAGDGSPPRAEAAPRPRAVAIAIDRGTPSSARVSEHGETSPPVAVEAATPAVRATPALSANTPARVAQSDDTEHAPHVTRLPATAGSVDPARPPASRDVPRTSSEDVTALDPLQKTVIEGDPARTPSVSVRAARGAPDRAPALADGDQLASLPIADQRRFSPTLEQRAPAALPLTIEGRIVAPSADIGATPAEPPIGAPEHEPANLARTPLALDDGTIALPLTGDASRGLTAGARASRAEAVVPAPVSRADQPPANPASTPIVIAPAAAPGARDVADIAVAGHAGARTLDRAPVLADAVRQRIVATDRSVSDRQRGASSTTVGLTASPPPATSAATPASDERQPIGVATPVPSAAALPTITTAAHTPLSLPPTVFQASQPNPQALQPNPPASQPNSSVPPASTQIFAAPVANVAPTIEVVIPPSAANGAVASAGMAPPPARAVAVAAAQRSGPRVAVAVASATPPAQLAAVQQPAAVAFAAAMFAADRSTAPLRGDPLADLATAFAPTSLGSPAAPIAVTPLAAAPQPVLDLAQGDWMNAMIEHIETIRSDSGVRETRIRLTPDALGVVDVSIGQDEAGVLKIRFDAETAQARTILAEAAPRLAEMAEARGLRLGGAGVDSGANPGQRQAQHAPAEPAARPASAANDDTDIPTDTRIA